MANTSARPTGSLEASARFVIVGSGYCGKRLQNPFCLPSCIQVVLPTAVGTDQTLFLQEELLLHLRKGL